MSSRSRASRDGVTDLRLESDGSVSDCVVVENRQVALVNLSMSGAQVCGAIHPARDQPLIFKIGWPQDRDACAAIARVRWVSLESEEAQREAIYRIGLAFETWDVRRLKEILRHSERTFAPKMEVIGPW